MRICLASLHPRRLSGQIESLAALGRELSERGHDIRLVTAFDQDALSSIRGPEAARELGATSVGKLLSLLASTLRLAAASRDADVIHLNLPTPAFSMLGDLLAGWTGRTVPIIVGYEAHLADVLQLVLGDYLRRDPHFYAPRVMINNGLVARLALFGCQRYVVASRWQRAELTALGAPAERVIAIPNLIDRTKLRSKDKRSARKSLLGEPIAGPLIGWAGHFHHVKGLDVLLRAFDQLAGERPSARLALAWSGIGDRRQAERWIGRMRHSERVIRLGRVEMGTLFSAVDVLALPYRLTIGQGAFPNLVMEAIAMAVPLITSDLPLLRELAGSCGAAALSTPGDPRALYEAICGLLDDPGTATSMRDQQRQLMDGPLAASTLADRYLSLYEEAQAEMAGRRLTNPPCRQ